MGHKSQITKPTTRRNLATKIRSEQDLKQLIDVIAADLGRVHDYPSFKLRQGAIRLCRNQCGQRVQVRLEHAAPVVSLDARRDLAGTVKLTKRGHNGPLMTRFHHCSAGTRHRIPDAERARSQQAVVNGSEQVASHTKEVLHETMHR